MKRNYFDSKATVDESLENVMKYINDWCDTFLEDAKRYESDRKNLDASKLYDDDETGDGLYDAGGEDDEKAKNDANWYDVFLEDIKRYRANMKDLDEDKEDNLEGKKDYDDEEARDDAAFADFDRKHVCGYDDEDDEPRYSDERFGAGFEIDEPRPEDYKDKKEYEDDLEAYTRFVEAGEECVRRGLEKPEWADSIKIDNGSGDTDDESSSDADVVVKIYVL